MTIKFTRKIGQNRGKPRLWIEGKHLIDSGLTHGTMWDLRPNETGFEIVATASGKRRIAGKPERPIVDINGTGPLGLCAECETVTVSYVPGSGHMTVTKG